MNSATQIDSAAITPNQRRKNRMVLLAIVGIVLLPVLVSSLMYFTGLGIPAGTVNRGHLITPAVEVSSLQLKDNNGQVWHWSDNGPVFKLVQVVDGYCSASCRDLTYLARQVHTRLGKNGDQVIRVLAYSGDMDQEFLTAVGRDYPHLNLLRGGYGQWQAVLPAGHRQADRLYVVDRRSHLVLFYDSDHDGGDILKDLTHLVKNVQ